MSGSASSLVSFQIARSQASAASGNAAISNIGDQHFYQVCFDWDCHSFWQDGSMSASVDKRPLTRHWAILGLLED
jgi:hypothetical protein